MRGIHWHDREFLRISGADRVRFLQDLVSNDVTAGPLIYTAMLTPQGKYLFDFFVLTQEDALLLDCAAGMAGPLAARLGMYKLRADVEIAAVDAHVSQIWEAGCGLADPRHPALGQRLYEPCDALDDGADWDALRVAHLIPETGQELIHGQSYILECNFEAIHGVDFKKGCYVGQEVTARMKHKTQLRKGLARFDLSEPVAAGTEITKDGKPVGVLTTVAGEQAIGWVRFDRAEGDLEAGGARVARRL